MVSAERLELSYAASETAVLPVRRSGNKAAPAGLEPALSDVTGRRFNRLNYGAMYPVSTGYLFCYNDLVDSDVQDMCQYHQIVQRGQRVSSHPLVAIRETICNGLRRVEPATLLYLSYP